MKGSRAVIEALKREGITHVFQLPGSTTTDMLDGLYHEEAIRVITTRHEQGAAHMADGFARASGTPGVCMVSRSPGATNIAVAMHSAHDESSPLVALIGQVSSDIYFRDCFEEMDHIAFFNPISKWAVEIRHPHRIPELLQRAINTAKTGRPGPVAVSIPLDVQTAETDIALKPVHRVAKGKAPDEAVDRMLHMLREAHYPLIYAGGGVLTAQASDDLARLSELLHIPVITTFKKKDIFPNNHPLFLGTLFSSTMQATKDYAKNADVILGLGCKFSDFGTLRYTAFSDEARFIHIDIDEHELGKVYVPEVGVIADVYEVIKQLIEACEGGNFNIDERRTKLTPYLSSYSNEANDMDDSYESQLIEVLQGQFTDDFIMVFDAVSFSNWIMRYFRFPHPGTLFASASGTMGWGFPASMGIKLAKPDKTVINVVGDGAFMMVMQELETAVREHINIITIIMNNSGYETIRQRQQILFDGREIGWNFTNPDFAELARLFGAHGERVEDLSDLAPAMERARNANRPAVIDVVQERSDRLPPGYRLGTR